MFHLCGKFFSEKVFLEKLTDEEVSFISNWEVLCYTCKTAINVFNFKYSVRFLTYLISDITVL